MSAAVLTAALALFAAYWIWGTDAAVWAGGGAILGHCFSVFLGGSGGKGVATALGTLLAAGRKAFKLTRAGLLVSQVAWQRDGAWDKVHAEHPRVGELGARSVKPAEAVKAAPSAPTTAPQVLLP